MEKYLIEHCAPTLASLKSASLFCITITSEAELKQQLTAFNKQFEGKGLFLVVLRQNREKALIYVCRKSQLKKDLEKPETAEFLAKYGYRSTETEYALKRLKHRLKQSSSFPHEIGIFLGYPLGDVIGFIRNAGKNSKCTGCWKVYCNECEAVKKFARFEKCRKVYARLWNQGKTVLQLTVAA